MLNLLYEMTPGFKSFTVTLIYCGKVSKASCNILTGKQASAASKVVNATEQTPSLFR